jgi:hypothetical protein
MFVFYHFLFKFQSDPKQWTSSEHSTACFLNNATFQNVVVKKFTFTVTLITSFGRSNSKGILVFKEWHGSNTKFNQNYKLIKYILFKKI